MRAKLERLGEQRRRVDVSVAVDLAVADERGIFQAGDEAEDARLLAELEVVLEADQVVAVCAQVFLAQLDDGVGPPAGFGVGEADSRRAEAERVAAAAGRLFDGQASLEVVDRFEVRGSRFEGEGMASQDFAGTASAVVRASRKASYSGWVKGQLM